MNLKGRLSLLLALLLALVSPASLTPAQTRTRDSGSGGQSRNPSSRTVAAPGPADVVWTSKVNVTATGNSLRKTSGCDGCPDAGAVSQQSFTSGDGYVEFTATETNRLRFAGLSAGNAGTDYNNLKFSIKLTDFGVAEVREQNQAYRFEVKYQSGDIFRITLEAGRVRYYQNGRAFYTSSTAPTYPLVLNVSLVSTGATINSARITAGTTGGSGGGGGGEQKPPVISAVTRTTLTDSSATVTWVTDVPSTSQAEYGQSTSYGSQTGLDTSLVTNHTVTITGLRPDTLYHYRVRSASAAGLSAVSADFTFRTVPTPDSGGTISDYGVYPEPPPPALPPAGGTFTDPVFRTTILRVTDASYGSGNNTYYSYWPSLNKDNSRLYIFSGDRESVFTFDPVNFRVSNRRPLFMATLPTGGYPGAEDAIWSGTDPDVMLCHEGMRLWAYNVATNTYRLIRDFTPQLGSGNLWQMSRSLDDNVFAFTRKDSNYNVTGYVAWNRTTDQIYSAADTGLDEVQVDKSGQYVVIKTSRTASGGAFEVQILNLSTRTIERLVDGQPDYAPGHSDNGAGFVIGADRWNNRYLFRRLNAPHIFIPVVEFGNDWSQAGHASMLQDSDSWVLLSQYVANELPNYGVFKNEIFLVATDGSKRVQRLAHHHSIIRDYWDTPRATISRDGRFVVFTSNWGGSPQRDVFIIRVPQ